MDGYHMTSKYGYIPNISIIQNSNDLINQIFKLLPYREQKDKRLNYHFTTLLFRLRGMTLLFPEQPKWVTVMALLESAQEEDDFKLYRKAILDSCSIIKDMTDNTYA